MMDAERSWILLVDDDESVGTVLSALLVQDGFHVRYARNAQEALAVLESQPVEVMITDLRMPGMDGLELLRCTKARWPEVQIIMLTAHGSIPLAVAAMQEGATDFLVKPFERAEVLRVVHKAAVLAERSAETSSSVHLPGMIAEPEGMMAELSRLVLKVAPSQATVLIQGETGTGKELLARAIHERSARSQYPFVVVNCAAVPEGLLEAELFGHEKGAFTGASHARPGRVRFAEGGTLFLDEIGEAPQSLQPKLLRLLQEKEVQPVGSATTVRVDVRIIAATHRDLATMVKAQRFREDLYYRLNVVSLQVPALRERPEDIRALAQSFCSEFAKENARDRLVLTEDAIVFLRQQPWRGNVRELRNFIERLVILSDKKNIDVDETRKHFSAFMPAETLTSHDEVTTDFDLNTQRKDAERDAILQALQRSGGNRSQAARILGISRRTLYNKLREHA